MNTQIQTGWCISGSVYSGFGWKLDYPKFGSNSAVMTKVGKHGSDKRTQNRLDIIIDGRKNSHYNRSLCHQSQVKPETAIKQ